VPRERRTRPVSAPQAQAYTAKAAEFLAAAEEELRAGRRIAATSLAVHAGINAADAVTGTRVGQRAAGKAVERARRCVAIAQRLVAPSS
jgi:hypothetical protein